MKDAISREALLKKIFPLGIMRDMNYSINAKAVWRAIIEMPPVEVENEQRNRTDAKNNGSTV